MVRRVVETAVSGGQRVVRPWLGARVQPVTQDLARSLSLPRPEGVLVQRALSAPAGERAGLARWRRYPLRRGRRQCATQAGVRYQFATQRPGARVPLIVLRDGDRQITLTANAEAPPGGAPEARELTGRHPLSGRSRRHARRRRRRKQAGLDPFADGRVHSDAGSRRRRRTLGFRPGDIIASVNGTPVSEAGALDVCSPANALG